MVHLSNDGDAEADAEQGRYSTEPSNGIPESQQPGQGELAAQAQIAMPLARGTAKARKAHKGFEKLLSAAGVWEVAKASGWSYLGCVLSL